MICARVSKPQAYRPRLLGVAMVMQASLLTGYFRNGTSQGRKARSSPLPPQRVRREGCMVMIGSSNIHQQARFW
jgi:hypothetical protein